MPYLEVIAQLGKSVLREVFDMLRQVQPDVHHQLVHRGVCCVANDVLALTSMQFMLSE